MALAQKKSRKSRKYKSKKGGGFFDIFQNPNKKKINNVLKTDLSLPHNTYNSLNNIVNDIDKDDINNLNLEDKNLYNLYKNYINLYKTNLNEKSEKQDNDNTINQIQEYINKKMNTNNDIVIDFKNNNEMDFEKKFGKLKLQNSEQFKFYKNLYDKIKIMKTNDKEFDTLYSNMSAGYLNKIQKKNKNLNKKKKSKKRNSRRRITL